VIAVEAVLASAVQGGGFVAVRVHGGEVWGERRMPKLLGEFGEFYGLRHVSLNSGWLREVRRRETRLRAVGSWNVARCYKDHDDSRSADFRVGESGGAGLR
jgi:hypothetical protein